MNLFTTDGVEYWPATKEDVFAWLKENGYFAVVALAVEDPDFDMGYGE
jgi:hypothetical protein